MPDPRLLAILGGPPLFGDVDGPYLAQLDTPEWPSFREELKRIYERHRLTNSGPLVEELERQLADYHGVEHCVSVSNAAAGITMLLQIHAKPDGEVIMPAFTYPGMPHFAHWAGQAVRYCDLEETSHGLDPEALRRSIGARTSSILSVSNFNFPGHLDALQQIAEQAGIALILDSVDGIGSSFRGRRLGAFGTAEVYSTHASKVLSGFEGGYITTQDAQLADILKKQRNFNLGKADTPVIGRGGMGILGWNAKLNEIHAAAALLALQSLDVTIASNRARYDQYCQVVNSIPGLRMLNVAHRDTEERACQLAVVEILEEWPLTRELTTQAIRAEGAACDAYYSPPLFERFPHLGAAAPDELPVTRKLAQRFFRLPVGRYTTPDQIDAIGELLWSLYHQAEQIEAAQLGGAA